MKNAATIRRELGLTKKVLKAARERRTRWENEFGPSNLNGTEAKVWYEAGRADAFTWVLEKRRKK